MIQYLALVLVWINKHASEDVSIMADFQNSNKCENTLNLSIITNNTEVDGWFFKLFNQYWLKFSNIFRVMLKFNNLSKVAAELKSATPTELRVFPPIAHSSACGSCNASVPVIDIAGPYRRTRRRLCAVSARSRLSTAGGSSPAARPQRSEALRGKSLQRGTAAPLSSPSSFRVCSLSARGSAHRPGVCASSEREEKEEEEKPGGRQVETCKVSDSWNACVSRCWSLIYIFQSLTI